MIIKINDNKNVFSSIVCEVNGTVFFFLYISKVFKTQIKSPQLTFMKTKLAFMILKSNVTFINKPNGDAKRRCVI